MTTATPKSLFMGRVGLPSGGPFGDLTLLYPPKGQGYPPQSVGTHSSWDAS